MRWTLALATLVLVAGCASDQAARDAPARILTQLDLPLSASRPSGTADAARRAFQVRPFQGWLDDTGAWALRVEVTHLGLRCGRYETGIRFGVGDAACSNVAWLGETAFGTPQLHCNGATLVHASSGRIDLTRSAFDRVNCARVLVRCTGACP